MRHPALTGIRTLIFDMDGTLIRSGQVSVQAQRAGLQALAERLTVTLPEFSDEELMSGIGAPSDEFYKRLLPAELKEEWETFRNLVFEAEQRLLEHETITFPGTRKTLDMLRARGYATALVSNCGSDYLNAVLDTQSLRSRFDIATCIGDVAGATKASLMADILSTLPGPAVMIGDRHYDVDAAIENGIPSVGCVYGYGSREELTSTTTWIEEIKQLAFIFNPLRDRAESIAARIDALRLNSRPFVVALDVPCEAFAHPIIETLLIALADRSIPALRLRIEDTRIEQTNSSSLPDRLGTYPWSSLADDLLMPRLTGRIDASIDLPARGDTEQGIRRHMRVRNGQVLVLEGSFLGPDTLPLESVDAWIRVDTDEAAVDECLSSDSAYVAFLETCGAVTIPEAAEDLERERQLWSGGRRQAWADYQAQVHSPDAPTPDCVLDGTRLAAGRVLAESWRENITPTVPADA